MPDDTLFQPRIKISWLVATLAAFGLFVAIGAYSARMTRDYSDYDNDRAQARYDTLAKLQHDELAVLIPVDAQGRPTAEWVDQDKGIVRIPIDEAMAKALETLKSKPAAIGAAIPGAAPSTLASPAPAPAAVKSAPAPPGAGPATAPAPAAAKPKKAKK